jgi:hypothetical protein
MGVYVLLEVVGLALAIVAKIAYSQIHFVTDGKFNGHRVS